MICENLFAIYFTVFPGSGFWPLTCIAFCGVYGAAHPLTYLSRGIVLFGVMLVFEGVDVRLQWTLSHVGKMGYKEATYFDLVALNYQVATATAASQSDPPKVTGSYVQCRYTVACIAAGDPPAPTLNHGLPYQQAPLLVPTHE